MEVFDKGVEHGNALVLLVVVWDFDLLVFEVLDKGSVLTLFINEREEDAALKVIIFVDLCSQIELKFQLYLP